jgi:Glycosyltransferase family 87
MRIITGLQWERHPAWRLLAVAYGACAAFGVVAAALTHDSSHRLWGLAALAGYLAAAVVVLAWRARGITASLAVAVAGALVTPLCLNAWRGWGQPEVAVVTRSALALAHGHSPYVGGSPAGPNAYNPYLPAMSLFGVPRALFGGGPLTDPRLWFALVFVAAFTAALAVVRVPQAARWTAFVAATPVVSLELTAGGTDVPVLALLCLGLALLWRAPRHARAGLVLGLAAAAKATAWPAVAVAAPLVWRRDGRKAALAVPGVALAVCVGLTAPAAVLWPSAMLANTVAFPLGLTPVRSDAASPLPGHLIATAGPAGRALAGLLLVAAGAAVLAWLAAAPPASVRSATWRLATGMSVMFLLAPATRFGYFIYPAGLLAWLLICEHSPPGPVPLAGPARAAPVLPPPARGTRQFAHADGGRP